MNFKSLVAGAVSAWGAAALAAGGGSVADKPEGFRFFNQHLTIKPYVSLSYTWDSNIDTAKHSEGDSILMVSPAVDFTWRSDRWQLTGSIWYRYNYYCQYNDVLGENSYGENLSYQWANAGEDSRGWTLLLSERYANMSQADSLMSNDGRGVWRDREHIDVAGALERRFTDRWHADVSGQYNWLDYKNDTGKYAPLYGWSEYSAGIEFGYMASKWTDILIDGGYSRYLQKENKTTYRNYSNDSQVWTIQGGIGSRATEKISYRALVGASWLNYGGHSGADSGWTYSLSGNWRITRTVQLSVLGSSHYQPSERSVGQAIKVYALSAGVSYLTLGDRMNLTANIAYRKENTVYSDYYASAGSDYDEDLLSARIGATYTFNRWVSVFADIDWEDEWASSHSEYEYDRFRGTIGLRFHY